MTNFHVPIYQGLEPTQQKYSSPRLVVDWMEELIVKLLLVINAQQNMYSIQKKNSQRYSVLENHPNTITNNIRFETLPEYEYE